MIGTDEKALFYSVNHLSRRHELQNVLQNADLLLRQHGSQSNEVCLPQLKRKVYLKIYDEGPPLAVTVAAACPYHRQPQVGQLLPVPGEGGLSVKNIQESDGRGAESVLEAIHTKEIRPITLPLQGRSGTRYNGVEPAGWGTSKIDIAY